LAAALIVSAGLLLVACGNDSSTASGQAIDITMTDNAYQPTQLSVPKGETVTLRFVNDGTVRHEAVLGDAAQQEAHQQEMSASTMMDNMDMNPSSGGDPGNMAGDLDAVVVEPGQTGTITTTFDQSGVILIGCHQPGHWEAGMKATIHVR
jgi:uncharacterized cupredoxin-like copper-binding protein